MHDTKHPWAGKTVTITAGTLKGKQYQIEDWWDHLTGKGWADSDGNMAAIEFAHRMGTKLCDAAITVDDLIAALQGPDDEVVYGHIGAFGKLMHVSQLPTELEEV